MFVLKSDLFFTSLRKLYMIHSISSSTWPALIIIVLFSISALNSSAQSGFCDISDPFCTDDVMVFPAGVNTGDAEAGPDYGCLISQHNPAWYHMRIAVAGSINIEISSTPSEDIDFICWGPFTDPHTPCSGQLTAAKIVDCSYSSLSVEYCDITGATVGEYYILMITNFSNDPCAITFSKISGDGETDCNIVPGAASNNSPICEGETLELYAEPVNNATYSWTGPNGFTSNLQNPIINNAQLSNAGTYHLIVTLNGNSSNPYPTDAIINALPVATFNTNTTCSGEETIFTDLSTCSTPATPIIGWNWDFGDGNTSSLQNPTHIYPISGDLIYNVKLIVTTSGGCIDSITSPVQVFGKPIANFSYTFIDGIPCLGSGIQFTDLSSTNDGNIESWNWDFGDGNNSIDQNPSHTYASVGSFTVSLTIENTAGCDSIIQQEISVYPSPAIGFSYNDVCYGLATQFIDDSFINVPATASWLYDFDDGSTSDLSNPIHTFTNAGDYNVEFSIIDTNGCSNSVSQLVPVFESAVAAFTFDTVCQFFETNFIDESAPSTAINSWNWDFGDTESSILQSPTHIYDTSGFYEVTLIIGNDNNCQDTLTHDIWVWQPPIANFLSSDTSCTSGLIFFNDSSYSLESNITSHMWNFPDGHVSHEPDTYFVFLTPETNYFVSLIVGDERGCMDTITESIYIESELQMSFIADTVCFGNQTTLAAYIVKPAEDSIVQYTWFYNDGGAQVTTPNDTVLYEFLSPGIFEVKLQATNIDGCQDVFRKNVKVRENPISDYSIQESFCHDSTTFSNTSIGNEGEINYWLWRFGDGDSLEVDSPNNPDNYHFYPPYYESYESSLVVIDEFGCSNQANQEVYHYPCVLVEFYNDTSWICENTTAV
ncbi:MAG: PKD domain-containing protein, partial [Bacteroidales bacterium]|nr:PKD domain-containing protein [Bacteroidales bacterium]